MKRMKQAMLFGFLVLVILCLPSLSDGFASHHTLCLQEWFVKSESAQAKNIMDTAHRWGVGG